MVLDELFHEAESVVVDSDGGDVFGGPSVVLLDKINLRVVVGDDSYLVALGDKCIDLLQKSAVLTFFE